jgi:hypothetical protein
MQGLSVHVETHSTQIYISTFSSFESLVQQTHVSKSTGVARVLSRKRLSPVLPNISHTLLELNFSHHDRTPDSECGDESQSVLVPLDVSRLCWQSPQNNIPLLRSMLSYHSYHSYGACSHTTLTEHTLTEHEVIRCPPNISLAPCLAPKSMPFR